MLYIPHAMRLTFQGPRIDSILVSTFHDDLHSIPRRGPVYSIMLSKNIRKRKDPIHRLTDELGMRPPLQYTTHTLPTIGFEKKTTTSKLSFNCSLDRNCKSCVHFIDPFSSSSWYLNFILALHCVITNPLQ